MTPSDKEINVPSTIQPSSEGIVEKFTIDNLTLTADSILVGEVTDITCFEENVGKIFTIVTFSVEQSIKGGTEDTVSIRVPGGTVNGRTLTVEDAPSFQPQERAVVFLDKGGDTMGVVGGFQGKFTVENDMVGDKTLTEFVNQIEDILSRQ